jgi:acyl-CoA thioester hydrolase
MKPLSAIFHHPIPVTEEHIDVMKHVNNEVYLAWVVQAATAHSESVGYDLKKYFEDGAAFVVRRHELDYLAPAFLGDELIVETWIADFAGAKTTREYKIIRASDQKVIVEAKTLWVYVNLRSGRPTQIPESIITAFGMKSEKS